MSNRNGIYGKVLRTERWKAVLLPKSRFSNASSPRLTQTTLMKNQSRISSRVDVIASTLVQVDSSSADQAHT